MLNLQKIVTLYLLIFTLAFSLITLSQDTFANEVSVQSAQNVQSTSSNSVDIHMDSTVTTNGETVYQEKEYRSEDGSGNVSLKINQENGETTTNVKVGGNAVQPTIAITNELVKINALEEAEMPKIETIEYKHTEMGVMEYILASIRDLLKKIF